MEIKRENVRDLFFKNYYLIFLQIPIEERQRQFRQLLRENKINSTSNWEEELPNVIFFGYFYFYVPKIINF